MTYVSHAAMLRGVPILPPRYLGEIGDRSGCNELEQGGRLAMQQFELVTIRNAAELRACAKAWDALWQRSEIRSPLARAESVALWLEHFAPEGDFVGVMIGDGERFRAALPLMRGKFRKFVSIAELPTDPWSICGDLLFDGSVGDAPLRFLVNVLERLELPLLSFEPVPITAPSWQRLLACAAERGWQSDVREQFRFGCIDLRGDWSEQESRWSSNHRRHMHKALRRAERDGGVKLRTVVNPPVEEIAHWLSVGFTLEDRNWKGNAGSSVLRSFEKFAYFCDKATRATQAGELHLAFLEHQTEPVAFEFGFISKGVYFSPKVGYDESYSRLTPGQLLRYLLLQKLCEEQTVESVDFWGPLSPATAKWTTHSYPRGRVILAPPRLASQALLRGFTLARSSKHWLRDRLSPGASLSADAQPSESAAAESQEPLAV